MKIIKTTVISLVIFGLTAIAGPVQATANFEDLVTQIKKLEAELSRLINLYEELAKEDSSKDNDQTEEKKETIDKPKEADLIEKKDCLFTRNLFPGVTGAEVKCLQEYLNRAGHTVALTGAGSPGNETMYYGLRTQSAVKAWQDAQSVPYGSYGGYFGPVSRVKFENI